MEVTEIIHILFHFPPFLQFCSDPFFFFFDCVLDRIKHICMYVCMYEQSVILLQCQNFMVKVYCSMNSYECQK
jgi:hypothetical protein